MAFRATCWFLCLYAVSAVAQQPPTPAWTPNFPTPTESDFTVPNYHFKTGEQLDVRMHYFAIGTPSRTNGRVTNAVLILHGTGGTGRGFLNQAFGGQLFGPGQLLDATKYFIVLPDNVGHGKSTKPSDGLRMKFPKYDYDDMVALQHALLTDGLKVDHLRLVMGTSMGCMHSWVWTEMYPDFMDAAMPLACLPVEIAGRNRFWRKELMDAIRRDPAWSNGDYTEEPKQGLAAALSIENIATAAPLVMQRTLPTREQVDKSVETRLPPQVARADANDMLYFFDSSRNYNPQPKLASIKAAVMAVNSADDFVNPPELHILEREIVNVLRGHAVILPITEQTRGHGTHSIPAIWGGYLKQLLEQSGGLLPGTGFTQTASNPSPRNPSVGDTISPCPAGCRLPLDSAVLNSVVPGSAIPGLTTADGAPVYKVGADVTKPRQTYSPDPEYPEEASQRKITGGALTQVLIGSDGLVKDAAVTSADDPSFGQASLSAVRTWRFEPATKAGQPVAALSTVETTFRMTGGHPARSSGGGAAGSASSTADVGSGVYRVGQGGVTMPKVVYNPQPSYTDHARREHISGVVILSCIVSPDGSVRDVKMVRGVEPSLDESAMNAVKQWRFEPATKDGKPVAVFTNIEVSFNLQ